MASLLGGDASPAGFRRAQAPGRIELPRDHGPHPDYRTEWWYFTGHLDAAGGRRFGFQLTFFRHALFPLAPASADSRNQLYFAHFALTDVSRGDHRAVERFARPYAGIAGVQGAPFAVWLDDWSARSDGESFLPLSLQAGDAELDATLALRLAPGKPPVFHGNAGLSAKGPEPGNASWYYSYTRLPVSGVLLLGGEPLMVSGSAWLDREWSSSSLPPGVVGWDWFGLQLDDGRELMLYVLRDAQGRPQAVSAGSLVTANGDRVPLAVQDFQLRPVAHWRSPRTGIRWPVSWRLDWLAEPSLLLRAAVADQEQDLSVRYWEGVVDVLSVAGERRLGRGYMELTGYGRSQPNKAR
ncbi:MAG: carotenoid 1,2-hydratase [Gammaproteobacteria bacterium]|nr:MAG: carotenoid 1,2-hydratase [Gammaproteobacteria bacterium]